VSARPIEVANVRDLPPPSEWPEWYVWVGRAVPRWGLKASPLANPFRLHRYPRERAVKHYRGLLESAVSGRRCVWTIWHIPFTQELARLRALLRRHGKLVLVGGPHAEVIKEVLLEGMV